MSKQEERLNYLKKTLLTMEWDRSQNQFNQGLEAKYNSTKEELEKLKKEASSLNPSEQEPAAEQES